MIRHHTVTDCLPPIITSAQLSLRSLHASDGTHQFYLPATLSRYAGLQLDLRHIGLELPGSYTIPCHVTPHIQGVICGLDTSVFDENAPLE